VIIPVRFSTFSPSISFSKCYVEALSFLLSVQQHSLR
jgi:hypothetical protein